MKYTVKVREVNEGVVTVTAASPEEAKEIAEQEYYNGNVLWDKCDFEITDVDRQKARETAR